MSILPEDFNWKTSPLVPDEVKAELLHDVHVFGYCKMYVTTDAEGTLHFQRYPVFPLEQPQ